MPAPSRVPFTKSKLALLLRRAYNQEKSNPQSDVNRPTKSFLFAFVFGDDSHAEEVPCPSRVFGYLSEGPHSCLLLPYGIVCLVQVLCLSRYFPPKIHLVSRFHVSPLATGMVHWESQTTRGKAPDRPHEVACLFKCRCFRFVLHCVPMKIIN